MGFRIFLHSIKLVFNQLNDALRISGALYLLSLAISAVGLFFYSPQVIDGELSSPWQFYLAAFLSILPYLWIAVGWHRFVLLDETPTSPFPPFYGDRILSYVGRGFQIFLFVAIIVVVWTFASVMFLRATQGSPVAMMISLLGWFAITILFLLIGYRLAPMLPAAAIGQTVGVKQAWDVTRGASGAFILLAVVSAIVSFIIDLPAQLSSTLPLSPILGFIWLSLTGWIKLMVGVSIMTTLYGVYVERRAIA